jgi:hypothetical protein
LKGFSGPVIFARIGIPGERRRGICGFCYYTGNITVSKGHFRRFVYTPQDRDGLMARCPAEK